MHKLVDRDILQKAFSKKIGWFEAHHTTPEEWKQKQKRRLKELEAKICEQEEFLDMHTSVLENQQTELKRLKEELESVEAGGYPK